MTVRAAILTAGAAVRWLVGERRTVSFDPSRRAILRTAGALTALAVVPIPVAKLIAHRFGSNMVIEGQTFVLDHPIVLERLRRIALRNCIFTCSSAFRGDSMLSIRDCENVELIGCVFDSKAILSPGGAVISMSPT